MALVVVLGVWGQAGLGTATDLPPVVEGQKAGDGGCLAPTQLSPSMAMRQGTDRPDWQMTQEKQQNSNLVHL